MVPSQGAGSQGGSRYCCARCGHVFDEAQALCEDWTDPALSFLCPACSERLVRADGVDMEQIPMPARWRARVRRWQREIVLGLALLCGVLLTEPAFGERAAVGLLCAGAFGIGLRALFGRGTPVQETLSASLVDRIIH